MTIQEKIKALMRDTSMARLLKGTLLLVAIQVIVFIVAIGSLPSQVPLYYSLPWGEAQLTSPWYLLLFPAMNVVILVINLSLAILVPTQERLLGRILIFVAAFIGFLTTIDLVKIILLIT